jgi:hypothetical protein
MRSNRFGMVVVLGSLGVGCIAPAVEVGAPASETVTEVVKVEAHTAPVAADGVYVSMAPKSMKSTTVQPTRAAVAGTTETTEPTPEPIKEPKPLVLDACDEADYADVKYVEAKRGHFTFLYLPGTAAERDLEQIATVRNSMFESQANLLGVTNDAPITVVLSPNRVAANAHGYTYGAAWTLGNRIEVLYLGTPDAYENRSPGHEVAHVIAARIDNVASHMPMLSEGLSEYLDGSGRDAHATYATALRAGLDYDAGSGAVTRFTWADVLGNNYDRAGSFVKFLVERYGVTKFRALWKASAISYSGWGWTNSKGDFIYSQVDLEREIDRLARDVYGISLDAMRLEWEAVLKPYLAAPVPAFGSEELAEIENLFANVDNALTTGNASLYRTAMEGFYCDYETDDGRTFTAKTAVEGRGKVKTTIVSAFPTGTRNYATALVHATRSEERGGVATTTTSRFWLERYPVGWRLTLVDGL